MSCLFVSCVFLFIFNSCSAVAETQQRKEIDVCLYFIVFYSVYVRRLIEQQKKGSKKMFFLNVVCLRAKIKCLSLSCAALYV